MEWMFYISAVVVVAAAFRAVTSVHPVHGLLYLVVSMAGLALVFFLLGAPFIAALQVIIYAGAVMILFLFVVMMLNGSREEESIPLRPGSLRGPVALALVLVAEVVGIIGRQAHPMEATTTSPQSVGEHLFGPYMIAVELASFLMLAGLIAAFHLAGPGSKTRKEPMNQRVAREN